MVVCPLLASRVVIMIFGGFNYLFLEERELDAPVSFVLGKRRRGMLELELTREAQLPHLEDKREAESAIRRWMKSRHHGSL